MRPSLLKMTQPEAEAILQRLRNQVQGGDMAEPAPPEDRSFGEQVAEAAGAPADARPAPPEATPPAPEPARSARRR